MGHSAHLRKCWNSVGTALSRGKLFLCKYVQCHSAKNPGGGGEERWSLFHRSINCAVGVGGDQMLGILMKLHRICKTKTVKNSVYSLILKKLFQLDNMQRWLSTYLCTCIACTVYTVVWCYDHYIVHPPFRYCDTPTRTIQHCNNSTQKCLYFVTIWPQRCQIVVQFDSSKVGLKVCCDILTHESALQKT
jgi:hypothetical protein